MAGRSSIFPEVSRTFTYGEIGTSKAQFSSSLRKVTLAKQAVDWRGQTLDFLIKQAYESTFAAEVAAARVVELAEARKPKGGDGGAVRVMYRSHTQLKSFCKQLGVMEDLKAGVPRTAYHGVIPLRMGGRRVFVAPSYTVDQDITK